MSTCVCVHFRQYKSGMSHLSLCMVALWPYIGRDETSHLYIDGECTRTYSWNKWNHYFIITLACLCSCHPWHLLFVCRHIKGEHTLNFRWIPDKIKIKNWLMATQSNINSKYLTGAAEVFTLLSAFITFDMLQYESHYNLSINNAQTPDLWCVWCIFYIKENIA